MSKLVDQLKAAALVAPLTLGAVDAQAQTYRGVQNPNSDYTAIVRDQCLPATKRSTDDVYFNNAARGGQDRYSSNCCEFKGDQDFLMVQGPDSEGNQRLFRVFEARGCYVTESSGNDNTSGKSPSGNTGGGKTDAGLGSGPSGGPSTGLN